MRFESLKGFAYGLWEENLSDVVPTHLPSVSPFPCLVSLLDSTRDWDRECGTACPGLWRFVGRDGSIIRIAWNGMHVSDRIANARVKWRTGGACFNPKCRWNSNRVDDVGSG
jgi:hypothetical protein